MQPQRDSSLIYLGPITAIILVLLGAWWYLGMLKQRVRDKPLAPASEPWRPNTVPFPTRGGPISRPHTDQNYLGDLRSNSPKL